MKHTKTEWLYKSPKTETLSSTIGNNKENCIDSNTWIKLKKFWTKAEAGDFARDIGWTRKAVKKLYGRFEYAWCVVKEPAPESFLGENPNIMFVVTKEN